MEALLLTVHMAVYLMLVMVVVLLSTISKKRKYTQRKPKEDPAAPPCPDCPYGYGRKKRSGDKYKATCSTCYANKKNGLDSLPHDLGGGVLGGGEDRAAKASCPSEAHLRNGIQDSRHGPGAIVHFSTSSLT